MVQDTDGGDEQPTVDELGDDGRQPRGDEHRQPRGAEDRLLSGADPQLTQDADRPPEQDENGQSTQDEDTQPIPDEDMQPAHDEDERAPEDQGTGLLVLAGAPIGDVGDASPRLAAELARADLVAAEDTRRLHRLLQRLGVELSGRVVSYFEGNEVARTEQLAAELVRGARVLVVTDAGMPSVSDPGYRLVRAAVAAGVRVTAVPGPSAVLTALAVSGLPVDRFCFEGFLPRKAGERGRRLAALATEERTMVFFEAPHRLAAFLTSCAEALGDDRPAAVCRELTKTYEEVRRGGLAELAHWAADGVRGEVTVVVQGAEQRADGDSALDLVRELIADGVRLSDAVSQVAASTGTRRNALYQAAVADRRS